MTRLGRFLVPGLLVLLCLAAVPARADGPTLFGDYAFGMPRQSLAALPGVYDCSADLGRESLCLDNVAWLNHRWELDFHLHQGRLVAVSLATGFSRDLYLDTFAAMIQDGALALLQTDKEALDVIALLDEKGQSKEFDRAVTEFEAKGMEQGGLAYVFVEKKAVAVAAGKARNLGELMAGADRSVRRSVLVLTHGEGQDWLTAIFEAPCMEGNPTVEGGGCGR